MVRRRRPNAVDRLATTIHEIWSRVPSANARTGRARRDAVETGLGWPGFRRGRGKPMPSQHGRRVSGRSVWAMSLVVGLTLSAVFFPRGSFPMKGASNTGFGEAQAAEAVAPSASSVLLRATQRGLKREEISFSVLFPDGTRWSHRATDLMKPASCQKLLIAAATLDRMGTDATVTTELYRTGRIEDGNLIGDLVVVGGGHPGTVAHGVNPRAILEEWSKLLVQLGIREVRGDLVADVTYLAGPARHPDWPPSQWDEWYSAPSGALNLNDNCHDIWIRPASGRIEVEVWPATPNLEVVNELVSVSSKKQHRFSFDREVGSSRFLARGRFWSQRAPLLHALAVQDPTVAFLSGFRSQLSKEGIRVRGDSRIGPLPRSARLLHRQSTLASAFLPRLLKRSQNLLGDCLQRVLGRRSGGDGSFDSGATAVADYARTTLGWRSGFVVRDGSGLSHSNRVTTRELVGLLSAAASRPWAPVFWDALPVAGRDGTLSRRFRKSSVRGRVHAKTGHLNGVASLAGRLVSDAGPIYFAVIFQGRGGRVGEADRWFEEILEAADSQ